MFLLLVQGISSNVGLSLLTVQYPRKVQRCWSCVQHRDNCMKAVSALCITLDASEDTLFKFCRPKCFDLTTKPPPHSSKIHLVREDWKLAAINDDVLEPSTVIFSPCCAGISPKHKTLLHVYVKRRTGLDTVEQMNWLWTLATFPRRSSMLYVIHVL